MDKIYALIGVMVFAISMAAANSFVDLDEGLEIRGNQIIDDSNDEQIELDPDGVTRFLVEAEFEDEVLFFNDLDIRGDIEMNQGDISNVETLESFFEQNCRSEESGPDGMVVVDVEDDGEIICENLDPRFYNLDGDRLEGNLNASGYSFNDVGLIRSNVEPLDVEGDFRSTGNVRAESELTTDVGTVTSEVPMCIGDQC